ncbi:cytosolic endo-beta-N-acetylglucosaminidase [Trichomycterus rosablanca]|uniref:cytosolic endo-beta-N-acetylglucosaminidase n=1 Tax=Trichomycterus rosablanca TaxID=2290929 RepID=UPI002F350124
MEDQIINMRKRREEINDEDPAGQIQKTQTESDSCLDESEDLRGIHEVITFQPPHLPACHYSPDTTEPISSALNSLDELLSWKRSDASPFNVATVPLQERQPSLRDTPMRTLVSHDMMGGYLHDRFIQGTEVDDPYVFYHWEHIDIFNYFSHHMVTVPPAMWTNAAHKHAVLSLGTFITEWVGGGKTCEAFLAGEEDYRAVADKLVQIAHCYGFDGWLINIENVLSAGAVKHMAPFLRYLTDQMHERVPGSLVIWYDSVLEDGTLKWQNQLNHHNRVFFQACDGIFTNYNWKESSLEDMASDPAAQGRLADVYVGVDVFARGEVVGGKFETNKALELVRKHGFSAALFAPGWVYECHDKTEFLTNQDKFWGLLSDVLYAHRPACPLPFTSSLCRGFGKRFYWRGKVEQERTWFNLSAQQLQPLYVKQDVNGGGWYTTRGCSQEVWAGGSALLLEGSMTKSCSKICARIFSLHVPLPSRSFISLVYRVSGGVNVSLELRTLDAALCVDAASPDYRSVNPVLLDDDDEQVKQLNQEERSDGWITRCFQLDQSGCVLGEVCVDVCRDDGGSEEDLSFTCRIGEISVWDADTPLVPPRPLPSVCVYDVVWRKPRPDGKVYLSATLRWRYRAELVRFFRVYRRHVRGPDPRIGRGPAVPIGRAYSPLYRVVELEVEHTSGVMELLVEPVSWGGVGVPESQWGRKTLSYTHSA